MSIERTRNSEPRFPTEYLPRVIDLAGRVTFYDEVRDIANKHGIKDETVLIWGIDASVTDERSAIHALTIAESQDKARRYIASPYDYTSDATHPAIAVYDAAAFYPATAERPDYHQLLPGMALEDATVLLIELEQ